MTIGERLRKARHAHHLSLQQVADQAELSSATLSRIETSKQNLDLEVFLQLAEILNLRPADLLDQSRSDGNHSLAVAFSSMNRQDRVGFWRDLIEASRSGRVNRRYSRKQIRSMALEIDELSAQIELMRETVEFLRKRLKNC